MIIILIALSDYLLKFRLFLSIIILERIVENVKKTCLNNNSSLIPEAGKQQPQIV